MGDFFAGIAMAIVAAILVLIVCAIYGLILGLPIMICWNYVMPAAFGLSSLTYLQSAALGALMYIFFGSSGNSSSK